MGWKIYRAVKPSWFVEIESNVIEKKALLQQSNFFHAGQFSCNKGDQLKKSAVTCEQNWQSLHKKPSNIVIVKITAQWASQRLERWVQFLHFGSSSNKTSYKSIHFFSLIEKKIRPGRLKLSALSQLLQNIITHQILQITYTTTRQVGNKGNKDVFFFFNWSQRVLQSLNSCMYAIVH